MATISPAPAEVHELIGEVIREYHPDLERASVTVGALMAWSKSGDPVKLHGYPCAATVKKNSARDRLEGKPDATITIDSDHWDGLDDRQRAALIDHEQGAENPYETSDFPLTNQIDISIIERAGRESLPPARLSPQHPLFEARCVMAARKSNRYRAPIKNRDPQAVEADGQTALKIPLTQGRFALIDPADYEIVRTRSWVLYRGRHGNLYARAFDCVRDGRKHHISMHKAIMRTPPGMEVDHINGDGLDNRRTNLRLCTHQNNMRNMKPGRPASSRFKGVAWYRRDGRWRAYLVIDAKQTHLGYFDDETEAAHAYDRAARRHFGAYARLNFPDGPMSREVARA